MASVYFPSSLIVKRSRLLRHPAISCHLLSSRVSSFSPPRDQTCAAASDSAISAPAGALCLGAESFSHWLRFWGIGLRTFMASDSSSFGSAEETSVAEASAISPEDVLNFWFAKLDLANKSYPFKFWFMGGKEADDEILNKFGRYLDLAIAGDLNKWSNDVQGKLALIIILDQFSRNVFRGTSRAFAQDSIAQKLTLDTVKQGSDKTLGPFERAFLYMPLMHSESLEVHSEAEQAYTRLADDYKEDVDLHKALIWMVAFEKGHKSVLEKFGRFPSRNAILGRRSTPEEEVYLASEKLWV